MLKTLRWLVCGLPVFVALVYGVPAGAQSVARAPEVNGLAGVMLGLLATGGVLAASFLSPRRTHQD